MSVKRAHGYYCQPCVDLECRPVVCGESFLGGGHHTITQSQTCVFGGFLLLTYDCHSLHLNIYCKYLVIKLIQLKHSTASNFTKSRSRILLNGFVSTRISKQVGLSVFRHREKIVKDSRGQDGPSRNLGMEFDPLQVKANGNH